jgi:pimeloyl-ACP methyl ester carboxylesterase
MQKREAHQFMSISSSPADYAAVPQPVLTSTSAGKLEHTDVGSGRPLLALHGGLGGYDQSWLLARALLAELAGFRVLALSRPGYLGTAQALGSTPEAQADAYAALLDVLGIERTIVVAVSAGGPSAIAFATRHSDRCDSLILVSTATGKLETAPVYLRRLRQLRWLAAVPGLVPLIARRRLANPDSALRRSVPDDVLRRRTLAHPVAGPLVQAVQARLVAHLSRRIPGTLTDTSYLQTMTMPDYRQIAAPILVVHGEADPTVPVDHGRRVLDAVPAAAGLILPGGGHLALFTHLGEVREKVASFLHL